MSDYSIDFVMDYFRDEHEFADDVIGPVFLNQLERDCVDTPEFQRLFRLSQLGLVDLVYHTANHTRGIHSIGACAKAKELVDWLNKNTQKIAKSRSKAGIPERTLPTVARSERCLISLAGLLHDIPHAPFSHDIERKSHRYGHPEKKVKSFYGPYEKHDDFADNPALYITLFDTERSVLARVLRYHSRAFWALLSLDAKREQHLQEFVSAVASADWPEYVHELLPVLLFHLLVFETLKMGVNRSSLHIAKDFDRPAEPWGIGPPGSWRRLHEAWYQPYRHDVVGNTLSADLLDYLARDAKRLGMRSALDGKLLEYYVLVDVPHTEMAALRDIPADVAPAFRNLSRCAIDLNDYKRGTIRAERINDVYRLLAFRHEIHEKAVYHRVVQSAIAMLGRAILLAGDSKPTVASLYRLGEPNHALSGDDYLLQLLADLPDDETEGLRSSRSIARKLIERRVYRPLMIVPGDQVQDLLLGSLSVDGQSEREREESLRLLGAVLDSRYFSSFFCLICWCVERLLDHSFDSVDAMHHFIDTDVCRGDHFDWGRTVVPRRVILWSTPYKQLYKDPALVVRADECVGRIDDLVSETYRRDRKVKLAGSVLSRLRTGLDDSEARYAAMWKIYVFISDGLFYTGGLTRLLGDHPCTRDPEAHKQHLNDAQRCLIRAIQVAWHWWSAEGRNAKTSLENEMPADYFRRILQMYTAHPVNAVGAISSVDFEHYLHSKADEHCRDVRYRFDKRPELSSCMGTPNAAEARRVQAALDLANLNLDVCGHEELVDIVSHLQGRLAEILADVESDIANAAGLGEKVSPAAFRRVWLNAEIEAAHHVTRNAERPSKTEIHETPRLQRSGDRGDSDNRTSRGEATGPRLLDFADPSVEGGKRLPDSPDAKD